MAKTIVAVPACLHNPTCLYQDTRAVSELFLLTYQYHVGQSPQEVTAFIEKLRKLVSLGYKASRQCNSLKQIYHTYRQQFLQYDEGDFRKHLTLLETFAYGLARMVQWAIQSYHRLGYPENYEIFLQTLEDILQPEKMLSISQQAMVYQLLDELKQLD